MSTRSNRFASSRKEDATRVEEKMPLIIDGYNLLNESGVFGRGPSLQWARQALLRFLADRLPGEQLRTTTVVFDAKDAPPGLPRTMECFGIRVRYASEYQEADDLIERLIRQETSPRQLTVVSSDHRLQRAARRRRSRAVDSDVWLRELLRLYRERTGSQESLSPKPPAPLPEKEIQSWLEEFGEIDWSDLQPKRDDLKLSAQARRSPSSNDEESRTAQAEDSPPGDVPPTEPADARDEKPLTDFWNPFPPGYGEDLLDDEGGG